MEDMMKTIEKTLVKERSVDLATKEAHLRRIFRELKYVLVAYSGGVDSSLAAKVAHDELGNNMVAVLAVSPSLAERERSEAIALAARHAIRLKIIDTHEVEQTAYRANSPQRCYYCKTELYQQLQRIQAELFATKKLTYHLVDGANLDDSHDYRPGRVAAKEAGVRSVLQEAAFTKQDVRQLAQQLHLPNHAKPATPCLASRVAYGVGITPEVLKKIEKTEEFLKKRFQLRLLRVRYHNNLARIETLPADFPLLIAHANEIYEFFRTTGFIYVTIDIKGFRSGANNEILAPPPKNKPVNS